VRQEGINPQHKRGGLCSSLVRSTVERLTEFMAAEKPGGWFSVRDLAAGYYYHVSADSGMGGVLRFEFGRAYYVCIYVGM
jgi:hypothetical protein